MNNKLYLFSDAFYTSNYDTYNHGVVAAKDEEEARLHIMTIVDLVEVGDTSACGALLFSEGVRSWPERKQYLNRTVDCPGWKVIDGCDISDYEKKIAEFMNLPSDIDIVFTDYAKIPETSEFGTPPRAGQWTVTATCEELSGSTNVHFTGLPSLDAMFEPAEHTAMYTWQETVDLPLTIEHVIADTLKALDLGSEYHDWATMVRSVFYSSHPVDGWEQLTEKIGYGTKTWYRNPAWAKLVPEYIRNEAAKQTVVSGANGVMRMGNY